MWRFQERPPSKQLDAWKTMIRNQGRQAQTSVTGAMDDTTDSVIDIIDKLPSYEQNAAAELYSVAMDIVA